MAGKWTWEFDEFAGSPISDFLSMGYTMEYVYHTTWKQKRAFPSFTFDCGMWWNLLHRNQTTDWECNMLCGIWHRLSTTEGFQLQSIPQMFTYFMQYHVPNPRIPVFLLQKQIANDKHMCPNEIPCIVSPTHSSYKQKHKWPLPGTNNSYWWRENSRRSFTLQDYFICQPFQTTLPWC